MSPRALPMVKRMVGDPSTVSATVPSDRARSDRVDGDWALLARAGEPDALRQLFDRHRDFVYRLAWSTVSDAFLAEDITQEVFLRIARGYRRWRPRAAFRTWLYRVVLNTARELARRRQRVTPTSSEADGRLPDHAAPPPDPCLGDLAGALDALPARQREVVVLRYLEGLSTRETAAVMCCRAGTVKAHLHRAMHALRSTFADPQARQSP